MERTTTNPADAKAFPYGASFDALLRTESGVIVVGNGTAKEVPLEPAPMVANVDFCDAAPQIGSDIATAKRSWHALLRASRAYEDLLDTGHKPVESIPSLEFSLPAHIASRDDFDAIRLSFWSLERYVTTYNELRGEYGEREAHQFFFPSARHVYAGPKAVRFWQNFVALKTGRNDFA